MQEDALIQARNVRKSFGDTLVVNGISFEIARGQCVGLLGPNGAGKTTIMRMIMGMTRPVSGSMWMFGRPTDNLDPDSRARVGLVPQEDNLDPDLTVMENLVVYARYFELGEAVVRRRADELLDFMQLSAKAGAKVEHLSGGMKRRLVIARSLLANPDVIILDEPTTGLDPQARVLIWRQLLALRDAGKTLLLSTHYMDEAERLCDRIILIDQGRMLDDASPAVLIERHVQHHVVEVQKPLPVSFRIDVDVREDIGDAWLFYVSSPSIVLDALPQTTVYRHRPANLEDVFLRLTGRQLREEP
jgi:lipooligosaccharide transport system ATP-binding protein